MSVDSPSVTNSTYSRVQVFYLQPCYSSLRWAYNNRVTTLTVEKAMGLQIEVGGKIIFVSPSKLADAGRSIQLTRCSATLTYLCLIYSCTKPVELGGHR